MLICQSGLWKSPGGADGIGYGQSWNNVTASRGFGTNYTNATTKPIQVIVSAQWWGGNQRAQIQAYVNGLVVQYSAIFAGSYSDGIPTVSFIVPSGSSYSVSGSACSVLNWAELR
jgi:hypothetical protein